MSVNLRNITRISTVHYLYQLYGTKEDSFTSNTVHLLFEFVAGYFLECSTKIDIQSIIVLVPLTLTNTYSSIMSCSFLSGASIGGATIEAS